jgi:primosomal protein N'
MFTHEDYRVPERIWNIVQSLREHGEQLYIQTFLKEDRIWKHCFAETETSLLQEEREGRRVAHLPPFVHVIQISSPTVHPIGIRLIRRFIEVCAEHGVNASVIDAPEWETEKSRSQWSIEISTTEWNVSYQHIAAVLRKFPPDWTLVMDPTNNL